MARRTLTDLQIKKIRPGAKRQTIPDPELRGHYLRVTPAGAKTFVAVARDPHGKQVWATIGGADVLKITVARERAREAIKRIKDGLAAFEEPPPKPDSFKDIAASYIERYVKKNGLRSQAEIERILEKYVFPDWRKRDFVGIKRSDVTKLLDYVQDNSGPRQADYVLAVLRGLMNWHAARTDDYHPPIVRGMRRTDPARRKRDRILDDAEIRLVWQAAADCGSYGAMVRFGLLTAQRREKIATMRWSDVSVDGMWTLPGEDREKSNAGMLKLPDTAVEIIRGQKRINEFVFSGRGEMPFSGFSGAKRRLDNKVLDAMREAAEKRGDDPDEIEPLPNWTFHDLRRSAKSLMPRAGVRPDISERVMGHAIEGVEGVYDRHSYAEEKADALERLAALVGTIIDPPSGNVVPIREAAE